MADREKVVKGLHCCSHTDGTNCINCPYDNTGEDCTALMSMDVLELLKEQEVIIEQYHKADGFLAAHGWKWEGGEVNEGLLG